MLKTLAIAIFVTLFSIASYAADEFGDSVVLPTTTSVSDTITTSSVSGAKIGSNENIGLYIIEWVLRGISLTSPKNTLFGAISGILNTLVLVFALVAIVKHGLQFVTLTTTKGTPGGNQLSGGVIAIRSSIAIAMLSPVIANGFSPVQLLVKETTMVGAYAADRAVRLSTDILSGTLTSETDDDKNKASAITPATLVGISDVVWAIALNETCSAAVDAYYALDKTRRVANDSDATPFTLRIDGDKVIYQWGWSRPYTKLKNARSTRFLEPTACGTVAINIPSVLSGKVRLNTAGNQFFVDPNPKPSPDEAIYTTQLRAHKAALENAIYNISSIVTAPLYKDQSQLMSLTALRYSTATAQQIETIQNQISTTVQQLPTEIPKYAAALIAIDRTYAQDIRKQGSVAARIIASNSAKTEVSLPSKVSNWWHDKKVTPRTWQETLNAQGFAALGGYYWIQIKTNMAINSAQEHITEKGNLPSIFEGPIGISKNKDLHTVQNLPNFNEIINRLARLREIYLTHRPTEQLEMNFTALRNATDVNDEQGMFKKIVNGTGTFLLESLEGAFISTTNNDLIVNLTNLGARIVGTAEVALLGIIAATLATKGNFLLAAAAKVTGVSSVLGILAGLLAPFLVMGLLVGLVLQFVLPAIPLIKWLVALQSWAIMMFVAMVYAPIWMRCR